MTEYSNLSETELQAVIDNAAVALKEKKSLKRKETIAEIKKLANSIGVTVNIIDDNIPSSRKGKKVPAKYRNPKDKTQTWTGRGVAPKWMQALIAAGHDKSEFLI